MLFLLFLFAGVLVVLFAGDFSVVLVAGGVFIDSGVVLAFSYS